LLWREPRRSVTAAASSSFCIPAKSVPAASCRFPAARCKRIRWWTSIGTPMFRILRERSFKRGKCSYLEHTKICGGSPALPRSAIEGGRAGHGLTLCGGIPACRGVGTGFIRSARVRSRAAPIPCTSSPEDSYASARFIARSTLQPKNSAAIPPGHHPQRHPAPPFPPRDRM
jgi:hypothetical protein